MGLGFLNIFKNWTRDEDAVAATEAALIFPILLTMLLSLLDIGNAVLTSQKTIRSSQIVADLLARTNVVDDNELADAVQAGQLSFEPFSTESYGYDIVSIRFNDDGNAEIVWRETQNMEALSNPLQQAAALSASGGGVLMVAVKYDFEPAFAGFVAEEVQMQEIAFARGRNTGVIERE